MNDTAILLGIGIILGALLSSGVWLVLFVIRKAERQLAREKSLVVKAVAEESAEADKVLSSAVAKSMNTHALRSALSPKIDKMQKMLTENMHVLDIYFVKYMELRIAAFRAAFEIVASGQPRPAVDRYPLNQSDTSTSIVQDFGERIESRSPSLPGGEWSGAMDVPNPAPEEETIAASPGISERRTVSSPPVAPAPAARMSSGPRVEPPPTEARLGVIRVSEDVREERPKREPFPPRPQPRPFVPNPQIVERRPALQPSRPEAPKAPAREQRAFDFEEEFGATVDKRVRGEIVRPADVRTPHADRTEKTVQWDRSQLTGAAAIPPEAIVVEGAEIARKPGQAPKKPQPGEKEDNPIISGEDIQNTMDSFFGLGDR